MTKPKSPTPSSGESLDLSFVKAARLTLPSYKQISLMLIGCGGTGSWLAPSVARIARILATERQLEVHTVFYDPDIVEAANISRQHFCQAEIGRNKAEALAVRYGLAWGVDIVAVPKAFDAGLNPHSGTGLKLFIGCVDNAAARTTISQQLYGPGGIDNSLLAIGMGMVNARWWLDCGNSFASGQVTLGCAREPKILEKAFSLPGRCLYAPAPSMIHPNLLVPLPEELAESNLSCEQIALRNLQGLAVNQQVAAIATNYLVQLLLTESLRSFATYFDLSAGSMRSRFLTPETIAQVVADWKATPRIRPRETHGPRRSASRTAQRKHHARPQAGTQKRRAAAR